MLVAEYMEEMETNNKYEGDWKIDGHDELVCDNVVPAATMEYNATEKAMTAKEYLAAAAKNKNDATKNENYDQTLQRALEKYGHAEPTCKKMGPATKTEYGKTKKRVAKEYLATEATYKDGVACAQIRVNDDDDKAETCDGCGDKRHHLREDNKIKETNKVKGKATTGAPASTVARATTPARAMTTTTPRKACTPTETTTDVLVDYDDNITVSSRAPPSISKFRRCKAFVKRREEEEVQFLFFSIHEECVGEDCVIAVVLATPSEVKPSCASTLKQGITSAGPKRGYRITAATLTSMSPHPSAPPMKKRPPPTEKKT